jgi:hypothetical protein
MVEHAFSVRNAVMGRPQRPLATRFYAQINFLFGGEAGGNGYNPAQQ